MLNVRPLLLCALGLIAGCTITGPWREQGPGPTREAQTEGLPGNPVSGGVNAIAVDRTRHGTVYLGTVNGGVWKSTNANSANPTWKPLTDLKLPALSINSIAISPLDRHTVFAGTGSTSSFAREGSPGFGVIRSTDGGAHWSILAASTFTGRRINSIVPTDITTGGLAGQVVLAATLFDSGGVYRSTDGGSSFTRVSGSAGLPDAGVSSLVADPRDNTRMYAAVPSNYGGGTAAGVYRSDDAGVTWASASTGLAGLDTSLRILLSVGRRTGVVYAMVINTSGAASGVFRSSDGGANWSPMGVPAPTIHPGRQGIIHASIEADPVNPNVVYVGGDRQDRPFPNANGCNNFSANIFRGDVSLADPWQVVVCNGARGTSPHADSRDLAFDNHGNLLDADDGGIYRLTNPDTADRQWESINGNLRPAEFHSAAYDAVSDVVFGGTQDTGTPMQSAPGSRTFFDFLQGDGGVVAVDDSAATSSIRYTSFQFLGSFNRSTWDASNNLLTFSLLGLQIVSGSGTGQNLFAFDPNIQFYNPYELNRIDPSRMLIGTTSIYESFDRGDTLANLMSTGKFISSLSYGGRTNGVPNPDAFYVGTRSAGSPLVLHRAGASAAITELTAYPGGGVVDLVMDRNDTGHVYVADEQGRVWASYDSGATWRELTANLPTLLERPRTIELYSPNTRLRVRVLMVAGQGGVFYLRDPGEPGATWSRLGNNLPHGLVLDLRYNYKDDVLTAGILGRGVWTLTNYFGGILSSWQRADWAPGGAVADRKIALPEGLPKVPPVARIGTEKAVVPVK